MIRALLVDDHAVVRVGFRLLLQTAGDVELIEAESSEASCRKYAELKPDLVVMDISMPGMGGIEAIRRIRLQDARARILALSAHDDALHAQRALRHGVLGFLSKRSAPEALLQAVRVVASGKRYMDPTLKDPQWNGSRAGETALDRLSEREFEVFLRLAKGLTVERIANDLSLSPSTVGTHLYNVKQKLGAVNQSELTLMALRLGLIEA